MNLWIKNGRVIDPAQKRDGIFDVLIEHGKVSDVLPSGKHTFTGAKEIDAKGLIVAPGFIDLHAHLREPGFEYKEDIRSGTASAVAGGFTAVCCMANTNPVNDNASVTDMILKKTAEVGSCRVYPIGAITKGLKGQELADIAELKRAGCVAISDDGLTVQNAAVMRSGMAYAKSFGLPVSTHSIDANLGKHGHMNESIVSTRLGIPGSPAAAEDVIIARDIMLSELTGAHLHVGHISTKGGVRLVCEAKEKGLPVTCEVTPHHFSLTDANIKDYDTNFKMCPPLRTAEDAQAIRAALKAGLIDVIATDHAPHGTIDKEVEFDKAAFGIIGFETALPLALNLVREKIITLDQMIALFTNRPAQVFSLPGGTLKKGSPGDVVIFDPELKWKFEKEKIVSKSKNSPFLDWELTGKVLYTVVGGKIK